MNEIFVWAGREGVGARKGWDDDGAGWSSSAGAVGQIRW